MINLWTLLHDSESGETLRALGASSRYHMQEMSVEPTDAGWVIEVWSAESGHTAESVKVLIPSDVRDPVSVIRDRVGNRKYYH